MGVVPLPFGVGGFGSGPRSQARYLGLDGMAYDTADEVLVADRVFLAAQGVRRASIARGLDPNTPPLAPRGGATPQERVANAAQNVKRASFLRSSKRSGPTMKDYQRSYGRRSDPAPSSTPSSDSGAVSSRGASVPAATPRRAGGGSGSASGRSKTRVLVDQSGQAPPIVLGPVEQFAASPLDPTLGARLGAGAYGMGGGQVIPVTPAAEAPLNPLEEMRRRVLQALLAEFGDSPAYVTSSPDAMPYEASYVRSADGTQSAPMTPDQANNGLGQMTGPAIAAYILNAWGNPAESGGATNMTAENIAFLQGLR